MKRYRIPIEYYEKLMINEKMQKLPLNSIENWQKIDKNIEFPFIIEYYGKLKKMTTVEFPLNNMGNWKIMKKYRIPIE